jgi:hypothetical protein
MCTSIRETTPHCALRCGTRGRGVLRSGLLLTQARLCPTHRMRRLIDPLAVDQGTICARPRPDQRRGDSRRRSLERKRNGRALLLGRPILDQPGWSRSVVLLHGSRTMERAMVAARMAGMRKSKRMEPMKRSAVRLALYSLACRAFPLRAHPRRWAIALNL